MFRFGDGIVLFVTERAGRMGNTGTQRVLMLMKLMEIDELEEKPESFGFCVHGRGHSMKGGDEVGGAARMAFG